MLWSDAILSPFNWIAAVRLISCHPLWASLCAAIRMTCARALAALCCLALALQIAAPLPAGAMAMIEICGENGPKMIAIAPDEAPDPECPQPGKCSLCISFGVPDPVAPAPRRADRAVSAAFLPKGAAAPLSPKRYQIPVSRGPPGGNCLKTRPACPTKIERGA